MTELTEAGRTDDVDSWEDAAELQQRDIDLATLNRTPIGINVENLVRVRRLGARRMVNGNFTVAKTATPVKIVSNSEQRVSLTITATGAGVYIADNPNSGLSGSYLPAGVPRVYPYSGTVWATCATTEAADAVVSYDSFYTDD